jgi:hypothetical protein
MPGYYSDVTRRLCCDKVSCVLMQAYDYIWEIWDHMEPSAAKFCLSVGRLPNHTELCWTEAVGEHIFLIFFVYEPAVQSRPKNQALCKKGVLTHSKLKGTTRPISTKLGRDVRYHTVTSRFAWLKKNKHPFAEACRFVPSSRVRCEQRPYATL